MFASNMYQSSHTALTFLFPIILNYHFLLNNDICHFVQRDGTERYFFLAILFRYGKMEPSRIRSVI